MISILSFDPGDHTGWFYQDGSGDVCAGTVMKNHMEVAQLIEGFQPEVVVLERFNLYPQMAKSLAWNSFYPCEVIGVIRYMCQLYNIPLVEQAPSVKKYSGTTQPDWEAAKQKNSIDITEHSKDAYMHYRYFLRNGLKKFERTK